MIEMPGGVDIATERDWDKTMFFDGVFPAEIKEGVRQYYEEGTLIQNAFPFLNSDEREFLMTGLTPDEFANIFKS
jgi:hypothetical protein